AMSNLPRIPTRPATRHATKLYYERQEPPRPEELKEVPSPSLPETKDGESSMKGNVEARVRPPSGLANGLLSKSTASSIRQATIPLHSGPTFPNPPRYATTDYTWRHDRCGRRNRS